MGLRKMNYVLCTLKANCLFCPPLSGFQRKCICTIFQEMEDDLNFSGYGRRPQFFKNARPPQVFRKYKTT